MSDSEKFEILKQVHEMNLALLNMTDAEADKFKCDNEHIILELTQRLEEI